LPFCFYGTQDVMPVNARLPRPFKRVVATIGPPLAAAELRELRAEAPRSEVYEALIDRAWQSVVALRGPTLARYLGKPPPAPEPVARSADDAAYLGLGSAWGRANWADTENSVPHGVASGPAPAGSQAVASGPAPAGPPDRLA